MWAAQYKEENNNTEGKENMTGCKESVRMITKLVKWRNIQAECMIVHSLESFVIQHTEPWHC